MHTLAPRMRPHGNGKGFGLLPAHDGQSSQPARFSSVCWMAWTGPPHRPHARPNRWIRWVYDHTGDLPRSLAWLSDLLMVCGG
jgi:hypothetical protein